MGYCIVHFDGHTLSMRTMDVFKLNAKLDNYSRLQHIYKKVTALISEHAPDCFAIEAPFFGKNVQSMLKLGRAQGVAIAAAIGAGIEVCEYSPRRIKQSITGNGNAGKEQVWKMLQHIMHIADMPLEHYDASDALAVAVCHHFQGPALAKVPSAKPSNWKQFINLHPDRIKVR